MKRLAVGAAVLALVGLTGVARADDKKPNPTGTWKWSTNFGGQTRETTLKLKLDGDKLTGAIVAGDQETAIEEGTYKDGEISFKVTRERNGQKMTMKYTGKVSGDTIKGKIEGAGGRGGQPGAGGAGGRGGRGGQGMARDWEAKRVAD
jgi:hypothetical protein